MTKKLAIVFPGQGSQAVGMLDDFSHTPALAALIEQADAALNESLGQLIAQGPLEQLNLTVNTQPAMLLAGYVAYQAWINAGGAVPSIVAGHSLGEYTALAAAQSIDLPSALRLVRLRAQAMQEAVPVGTGSMAAILGLSDDLVRQACLMAMQNAPDNLRGQVVEPVNFNAPMQVVIAGHNAAVLRACEAAKTLGAKRALPLSVSAPFHSSLLKPAGERLALELKKMPLGKPMISVINNIDVLIESDPAAIAKALVRQASGPVRWVELVNALANDGVTHVIECGPGKVLGGMIKRIAPSIQTLAVFDTPSLNAALASY